MISALSRAVSERRRMPEVLRAIGVGLILGAACVGTAYAQAPGRGPTGPPDKDVMYDHIKKAQKFAGTDLEHHFFHRCFVDPVYSSTIAKLRKENAVMEPVKVFDNLYFVGQNSVSSWLLQTSEGFIVIDTLNNSDEAKQYIEGGMVKLGLDPARIKYILLTHEHFDHYAGANYLQKKFGAKMIASSTAWDAMAKITQNKEQVPVRDPARDIAVTDGQKMTIGDTTLSFYVTPGHADGALSTIFKVTDHGEPHVVGFAGGLGSPFTAANRNLLIKSLARWETIAKAAGVDTLVANHQGQDYSVENLEYVKIRRAGDKNPFVIGQDAYSRYIEIQRECTMVNLARNGQKIEQ